MFGYKNIHILYGVHTIILKLKVIRIFVKQIQGNLK